MNFGQNVRRGLVAMGLALGFAAAGTMPAYAENSALSQDNYGDTVADYRGGPFDFVALRVVEEPGAVTVTVTTAGQYAAKDWAAHGLSYKFWAAGESPIVVSANGSRLVASGGCTSSVGQNIDAWTLSVRLTGACRGGFAATTYYGASSYAHGSSVDSVWQWTSASGYVMATAAGDIHSVVAANFGGQPPAAGATTVDVEMARWGSGYWMLDSSGIVTAKGYTKHFGNAALQPGERAVSLSVTPSEKGYWVFSDKGRAIALGDAMHFGDMAGVALQGAVLDSIATPTGNGYYVVASDGGVFAFGDARFHGSMGGVPLNKPVQSLVPDPDGTGYWLVASDGGVFAFEASFRGSMGGTPLNKPVTGMVPHGDGYLMVGEDGGVFNFSDKPFFGSLGSTPPSSPVVAVAAARALGAPA